MDYKYIEQLLERYWECQTSEAEESILRTFFSQPEVPAELARYKDVFDYERTQADETLAADFEERMLALIVDDTQEEKNEERVVFKARRINWAGRFAPLYRAAAAVAVVMILGATAQRSFNTSRPADGWDYNSSAYTDSYAEPQQAYEAGVEALQLFREGPQTAIADSMKKAKSSNENAITTDID